MAVNASLEHVVAQRTADLQEIVAGLETFNRSVSHDLRGSLGGIAGFARLADEALRDGDPEVARQALPLIADQAERSVRLVNALLELAHAGDGSLRTRKVSLRQVVDDALSHLAAAAGGSAIPKIEIGALPEATVDPDMMQRVFANLIGNAIKFTRGAHDGHVVIDAARGGDGVVVSVRDNGVGFEASAALRIFEPFFRAHGRAFDGDGVGLSIVRRAVERHGGRVWAESAPGAGATFFFTLPA